MDWSVGEFMSARVNGWLNRCDGQAGKRRAGSLAMQKQG